MRETAEAEATRIGALAARIEDEVCHGFAVIRARSGRAGADLFWGVE